MTDRPPARTVGLVLEQCLSPVPGGTGRYSFEIAAALARTEPSRRVRGFTAWHRSVRAARVPGVDGPRRLPLPRRGLVAAWDVGLPSGISGVDLLHAPTVLAPRRGSVPLVVTIHDAIPWTHPETLTARGASWHRRSGEHAAKHADAIVVPTQAAADELAGYLDVAGKTHVVGLGVSDSLVVPEDQQQRAERLGLPDEYVVSVATVEPRKGLDTLIDALGMPLARGLHLVVVGQPGWGGVDLADLTRRAGVDPDRVVVTGRIDDADLATVVSRATALVSPSRAEGFGIPVIEAMHLGTPVIHSDAPALVEVAGGAGIVVPRESPRLLAEAMLGVIQDRSLQRRLRDLGRARAADFSWDRSARLLWDLYDGLVEAARG